MQAVDTTHTTVVAKCPICKRSYTESEFRALKPRASNHGKLSALWADCPCGAGNGMVAIVQCGRVLGEREAALALRVATKIDIDDPTANATAGREAFAMSRATLDTAPKLDLTDQINAARGSFAAAGEQLKQVQASLVGGDNSVNERMAKLRQRFAAAVKFDATEVRTVLSEIATVVNRLAVGDLAAGQFSSGLTQVIEALSQIHKEVQR